MRAHAHITVCSVHVRIQGSNVRKCVFSLYEELRVTQCSRIPPEGTQWPVRPAPRYKKQKHKAFIHSPRSLYLSLSLGSTPLLFPSIFGS